MTFTSEELTELEEIVRRSAEHLEEVSGSFTGDTALRLLKKRKLLKSLHLKVQAMCIEHPKEREQLELDLQGMSHET
tara:strand:- start:471 stop:701 length:231 start_codon:yes stop_codon:yes gene_type:complete